VLGADEDSLQRTVGEVDPLGWSRGAAREHSHRSAPPPGLGGSSRGDSRAGRDGEHRSELRHSGRSGVPTFGDQVSQVQRIAGQDGQVKGGDVLSGAVPTPGRVDGHHAPSGTQNPEQKAHGHRVIAKQEAYLITRALDQCRCLRHGVGELSPRAPRPTEFDRVGTRIHRHDVADPAGESSRRQIHRSFGSAWSEGPGLSSERTRNSAMPRGLPSRV
jgi:hypothetical protein